MLQSIVLILATSMAVGWLFEKINQTSLEPFERIQSKTRYIKKKKVWKYVIMVIAVTLFCVGAYGIAMNQIVIDIVIGVIIAFLDVVFESTVFDQMRNTLR